DREGAERGAFAVRSALELRSTSEWRPPVLLTTATQGAGVTEVVDAIEEYFGFLRDHGQLERRRRQRLEHRLQDLLKGRLWAAFTARVPHADRRRAIEDLAEHRVSPHQADERLLAMAEDDAD